MNIKTELSALNTKEATLSAVYALEQRWRDGEEFSYMKKARPNGGIMLVECKNVCFELVNGEEINAPRKSIVYIPPGCNYSASFFNPEEVFPASLLVNFTLKDKDNADVLISEHPLVICKDRSNFYRDIFIKICEAYMNNSQLVCMGEACLLIDSILKEFINNDLNNLSDVYTDYIRQRLGEDISISVLCREFAMSESTLQRRFKELFGISPLRYINELRVEGAKKLLAIPEISLDEICTRLGFYDSAHLNKCFKAKYGLTPIQYRRSCFCQSA